MNVQPRYLPEIVLGLMEGFYNKGNDTDGQLLKDSYPELYNLVGVRQSPTYHFEGTAFRHTIMVMKVAIDLTRGHEDEDDTIIIRHAALLHDSGKKLSRMYEGRHEIYSVVLAENFLNRVYPNKEMPSDMKRAITNIIACHMRFPKSRSGVRKLVAALYPATISQWEVVCTADMCGRIPRNTDTLSKISDIITISENLHEPVYTKGIIDGRYLILKGLTPSPFFSFIIEKALSAEEDGKFSDEEGADIWYDENAIDIHHEYEEQKNGIFNN